MSLKRMLAPLVTPVEDYRRDCESKTPLAYPLVDKLDGDIVLRMSDREVAPVPASSPWSYGEPTDICGDPQHPVVVRAAQVVIVALVKGLLLLAARGVGLGIPLRLLWKTGGPRLPWDPSFLLALPFCFVALIATGAAYALGQLMVVTTLKRLGALLGGPITLRWRGDRCIASHLGSRVEVEVGRPVAVELVLMKPREGEARARVKAALVDAEGRALHLVTAFLRHGEQTSQWDALRHAAGQMAARLGNLDLRVTRATFVEKWIENPCPDLTPVVEDVVDVTPAATWRERADASAAWVASRQRTGRTGQ